MSVYEQIAALAVKIGWTPDHVLLVSWITVYVFGLIVGMFWDVVFRLLSRAFCHFKKNKPD